jgi:PEP-CTERM motif
MRKRTPRAFLAAVLALSIGKVAAAHFTIINIADTSDDGLFLSAGLGVPSLNDSGTVAFAGILRASGGVASGSGIFTSKGGPITTLYDTSGPFRRLMSYCCASLNNNGTVAFFGTLDTGGDGIFTGSGGPTTTIFEGPGVDPFASAPVINDSGMVAFRFLGGGSILLGSGGPLTTIADTSGPFASIALPSLNDSGTVAFAATLDTGGDGIFISSGGLITTIADSSGPFDSFIRPNPEVEDLFISLNNAGTVAFSASLDTGARGIFTSSGGLITTIVDSSGPFAFFFAEPSINDSGMVAFLGGLDSGGFGIFAGPDPADEVIRLGDRLLGSTVTRLILPPDGFNDSGQIAFQYFLANGLTGIARADPRAIPEPGTLALLGLGVAGLGFARRRSAA